jgi:sporulation protein YlmC with PRC-barrel domain
MFASVLRSLNQLIIYGTSHYINSIMEIQLSSLYGQDLYTDRGIYVGKIEDVSVDIKEKRVSGLAVKNVNPNAFGGVKKKGVIIPYRWVTAIGDIVLIKHVRRKGMEREREAEEV